MLSHSRPSIVQRVVAARSPIAPGRLDRSQRTGRQADALRPPAAASRLDRSIPQDFAPAEGRAATAERLRQRVERPARAVAALRFAGA